MKEVGTELLADYVNRSLNGDTVTGNMADEFQKAFDASLHVNGEIRFEDIMEFAEESDLVFDFIDGGLCFGRSNGRIESSNCKQYDVHGIIMLTQHRASEELCNGCPSYLSCKEIKQNQIEPDSSRNTFNFNRELIDAAFKVGVDNVSN